MSDIWITVKECAILKGMPIAESNVRRRLESFVLGRAELRRKRTGSKAFEYHISILPADVRAELLASRGQVETSGGIIAIPEQLPKPAATSDQALLWKHWEAATDAQRLRAEARVKAVGLVAELVRSGLKNRHALFTAARQLKMSEGSLRNIYYKAIQFDRSNWAPALLDRRLREPRKTGREAPMCDAAWQFFIGDYLRYEEPCLSKSYEFLKLAAKEHGWQIPSERTLRRRVERDIDARVLVAARKGDNALAQLYPSQRRTVEHLLALEWINGDGYQHNVFVTWHNGEVLRPKTWVWQDVYSRKIIGWRTDVSENTDSIRLSLMDVIQQFGKPEHAVIDNTRAAANKWLTGGVPNRYRFKIKPDDPMGILPLLGIDVHWTSIIGGKGWGQAKPIERAFGVGGLGDYIDKHPSLAGAYTGPNVMNKPENYGERAVDVDAFMSAVAEGIAMFNAKLNRDTEMCDGKLSFDQAFEASYSNSIITRLGAEQIRQLMLPAEAVTVRPSGEFFLSCGGSLRGRKNAYWNPMIANIRPNKVTIRFDPRNLHGEVACYSLEGSFICMAECRSAVAFNDTQAGREHGRHRTAMMKATKKALNSQRHMDALEVSEMLPKITPPEMPARHVVERFYPAGNTVRKLAAELSEDRDANEGIFNRFMSRQVVKPQDDDE